MGRIALVIPEATTNLVTNPSIELATTGYTAIGAGTALARAITYQQRGAYSLSVTPDTGNNDGVYYAVTLAAATQYTVSVDVKGANGIPYRIHIYDVTAAGYLAGATPTQFTGDGEWHRQTMTFTTSGNTSFRIQIEKDTSASVAVFYADGLQCEAKGYDTTYCDGDQSGCEWNGAKHASASARDAQSRAGGRVVDLDDYSIHVQRWHGVGMPPLRHNVQGLALQPGALMQSVKAEPRLITLTYFTDTTTEAGMYAARKSLIDALKPDRVATLQPVLLRYTNGAGDVLEIECYYDAGLQGDYSRLDHEVGAIRLIAYHPFWREMGESAVALDTNDSLTIESLVARIDGQWSALGPPSSGGAIRSIAVGPDGIVYLGGAFTNWDGIANADYVVAYDPQTGIYSALGTGMNNVVEVLLVGPDGTLYAGGDFTTAGGGAANRIASWNGSAWSALGTGMNGTVYALAIAPDGTLYAGGNFTTADGGAATYIAQWNGAAWSAVGTGVDAYVNALAVATDGTLYVSGNFANAGGGAATKLAIWNGSAWSQWGDGDTVVVLREAIVIAPDGTIYHSSATIGGSSERPVRWNGSNFVALSDDADSAIQKITLGPDGTLYVSGAFTVIGGLTLADRIARWNGFAWAHLDIDAPGAPTNVPMAFRGDDFYVGFGTAGTAAVAGVVTASNSGTVKAYPRIIIKRSGGTSAVLQTLKNETTGDELVFNLSLMDGETVIIDFTPGQKRIYSDFRGTSLGSGAPLPGSDFAAFGLLPGDNLISCFISTAGSPTITAEMIWRNAYWSVDGV